MGVDFLSKAGKSIERKLDKALVELGTPSLFSANPEYASRTCAAALVAGEKVVEGETLVVRLEDNGMLWRSAEPRQLRNLSTLTQS